MAQKNNYKNTYIEGNTVRKQQTVPVHRESAPARKREETPVKTREEIIRQRERRLSAKRNQQRAMMINRGYIAFLTAATLVCCCFCAIFVHVQSNITMHMSAIASLETELSNLKADNDAASNRLETTMTLEEIKQKAGELGLVYPAADQIHYYSVESSDYMNQYSDVASR